MAEPPSHEDDTVTAEKDELLSLLADSTREVDELAAALAAAKRQQIARVAASREAGATWAEIGERTSKARTNARRDFGPHIEETVTRTVRPKETP